jgi:thiazole synthase ThiGH ThiG subunit
LTFIWKNVKQLIYKSYKVIEYLYMDLPISKMLYDVGHKNLHHTNSFSST